MRIVPLLLLLCIALFADTQYKVQKLLQSDGIIWGFDFIGSDKIIFTQREGAIKLFNLKEQTLKELGSLEVELFTKGQGGLLDVALSPEFETDRRVYFTYSKQKTFSGATALGYALFKDERLQDFKEVLVTDSFDISGRHFGSRITFDKEGNLYFSIGDRGERDKAQQKTNHNGTILQVDTKTFDYTIYSYGHRNPQGLFYDTQTDTFYANEHGPRGGDEINIIKKGANYGWPIVSLGNEYLSNNPIGVDSKEGMVDPIYHYTPSIAPSAMIVYKGRKFKEFQNSFISPALAKQLVSIVDKKGRETRILMDLNERFRNVKEDAKGNLYFSTDSGKIYKLLKR